MAQPDIAAWFDKYGPAVYRRARYLLGNHEDAQEATQEVFIRAMKSAPHFEGVKFAGKKNFKVDAKMKSKGGDGAKAAKGYLIANTKPWARVIVDGRDTGLWTPIPAAKKLALPAGNHKVTFKTQDGQTLTVKVEIQPGKTAKIIKKIP